MAASPLESALLLDKLRRLERSSGSRRTPYRRRAMPGYRYGRRSYGRRSYGRRYYRRRTRRWYWKRIPVPEGGMQRVPLYARLPRAGWVYDPVTNSFKRAVPPGAAFNVQPMNYAPNAE